MYFEALDFLLMHRKEGHIVSKCYSKYRERPTVTNKAIYNIAVAKKNEDFKEARR